jgi:hypothetical protein
MYRIYVALKGQKLDIILLSLSLVSGMTTGDLVLFYFGELKELEFKKKCR